MSPSRLLCIQRGPQSSAFRIPSHGVTGAGFRHRSSPTGGAAYGIALKRRTPESFAVVPAIIPPSTVEGSFGTYLNKKFNTKKPKPVLQLCGWTGADGQSSPPAAEKAPFNDKIDF